MTTQTTIELSLNLSSASSNVWSQVLDQSTGLAYTVPSGRRGNLRDVAASNLGANSATFEYAIGSDVTIADAERKLPPLTVPAGGQYQDSRQHTIPALSGLWVRGVGTSLNMTVSAQVLEVTP